MQVIVVGLVGFHKENEHVSHLQLVPVLSGINWQICLKNLPVEVLNPCFLVVFLKYGVNYSFIWKGERVCLLKPFG